MQSCKRGKCIVGNHADAAFAEDQFQDERDNFAFRLSPDDDLIAVDGGTHEFNPRLGGELDEQFRSLRVQKDGTNRR